MTAVFREIKVEWDGATHTVTPTFRLINEIEQEVSLSRVAYRMMKGDAPISHMALILARLLQSVGVQVKDEEVYQELMLGGEKTQANVAEAILYALYPNPRQGKERAAPPAGKRARKKAPAKKRTSRGRGM